MRTNQPAVRALPGGVQGVFPWIALFVTIIGIIGLQEQEIYYQKSQRQGFTSEQQEASEKQQLRLWQTIPSIGFSNLIADWMYLRFIQYFGDSQGREKTGYALSPQYFKLIVERDPRFVDAILKLDTATSIFDGNPQKSVVLLTKALDGISPGLKSPSIPPYYLWSAKGINQLLFLGDPQGAKQSYEEAVKWAKYYPADQTQNFITNTNQTIQFLSKNPKSRAAQIGAWASILGSSPDPRTIQRVMREIKQLGGELGWSPDGRLTVRVPSDID